MKSQFKKVAAVTLAMTMCLPGLAFADDDRATVSAAQVGSFDTSFDVYAPAIAVSVPVNADIRINPLADDQSGAQPVKNFTVASNSIDIRNGSVDDDGNGIPVNVTVSATISGAGTGVRQLYNTFTPDSSSTEKKIHLELMEASTAADATGTTDATYDPDNATNKATITKYGSMLSVDIAGPTNATTPTVGSFAVIGEANYNADWAANDIKVGMAYKLKASKALTIVTPAPAAAPTATAGADVNVTVPSIGEAKVVAVALHNDEKGAYGDFVWEDDKYTADYDTNPGGVIIKIDKADGALALLKEDAYKTKPQDMVIALSDGRMVVTTLTIN